MNNITVAISLSYHDRSITVLDNGKLVDIILEDRISRKKYDYYFPLSSLNILKSKYSKIDKFILINCYDNVEYKTVLQHIKKLEFDYNEIIIGKVEDHHLYHAFAGFCSSKFDEATVLVIDGFGGVQYIKNPHPTDFVQEIRGVTSTSIWNIPLLKINRFQII
jgi:predicted NodU family carbamoyl transferase